MEKGINLVAGENKLEVIFDGALATIKVNERKMKTTYASNLNISEASEKLSKLLNSENAKSNNPLAKLFAFGQDFRLSVMNVIKDRA